MYKSQLKTVGLVIMIILFSLVFSVKMSFSETIDNQNSEIGLEKIDSELLNEDGETSVIIEFSKKPGNYKQIIKSLGGNIVYDYDLIDAVAVRLEGKNIPQLTKLENLVRVHKNRKFKALLNDSAPLISANSVWAQGYTGKDVKVCIVDTGIDYTHQALGACSMYNIHGNTEPYYNESPHIGCNNLNLWYNITKPGFTNISIHFVNISTEPNYDFLYIRDANDKIVQTFTGIYNDVWTVSVPGDTIKINLVTDGYGCLYGFYTDKVLNGTVSKGLDNCSKVIAGHDFVNYDDDPMDDDGHGTHVAGIISSNDPTYRGIANGTKLMAAKVLDAYGNGYENDVIAGIQWCKDNGAQIISMSLGGVEYPGTCDSDPVAQAVNNAVDNGIAVAIASGNSGLSGVTTPACASKALAVGATDKNKNVVGYSSKGPELDIVAPGHLIKSTYPGGWITMSGTSMAAPHVAGVIALMLEKNPSLSISDVKRILNETSDPVNKCYEYEIEIPCDRNSTGSGIVNASRAVEKAQSDCIITVQYNDCPRYGANVVSTDPLIEIGNTDENGRVACNNLEDGLYTIKALWPNPSTQFGGLVSLEVTNGYGRAIIQENNPYPSESCGNDECDGTTSCVSGQIVCSSFNTECDTKKCCLCNGGTQINPSENYDETQDNDCSSTTCPDSCDVDSNSATWDYANDETNYCQALDQCTSNQCKYNHVCADPFSNDNVFKWEGLTRVCNAQCDQSSDCASGLCRSDCTCASDTTPPVITILSPENKTYLNSIPLTFKINEPASWIAYSLDGASNKTIVGNTTIYPSYGSHNIVLYAKDMQNNVGKSNKVYFKVNSPPPAPNKPNGPISGIAMISYNYSTSAVTDPDGDSVSYIWEWGDGSSDSLARTYSSHFWVSSGTYRVVVKARDIYGATSGPSQALTMNITKPSCSCTTWQPAFTCCSNGMERWIRTCNPKGCDFEGKCDGKCFV